MMPLLMANAGEENIIKKIGGLPEMKKHLSDLGFVVGGTVTVVTSMAGNVIVNVKDTRVALAKEMAQTYGITPKKTASLLDTFSCITQGILPYGAQMLVAISAVTELGKNISAFDIIPYMFYPLFLLISSLIWIGVKTQ